VIINNIVSPKQMKKCSTTVNLFEDVSKEHTWHEYLERTEAQRRPLYNSIESE
jgi:hypothetical protein